MKSTANTIVFESTGREVYANHAIVGISPNGQIFDGYDGYLEGTSKLTQEERKELASHMIERWKEFAAKVEL